MIELAAFLGNPGSKYAKTRHNYAQMLLEALPGCENLAWRDKFHGKVADYGVPGGKCRFLVPETYMNVSGKSVAAAASFHKTAIYDVLVIHDDLELPFGCFAWRVGGGLAGHNGLKSIRDAWGNPGFRRLRLGIGRPTRGSVQSWVLGRFSPEEESMLPLILERAAASLSEALSGRDGGQDRPEPVRVYEL